MKRKIDQTRPAFKESLLKRMMLGIVMLCCITSLATRASASTSFDDLINADQHVLAVMDQSTPQGVAAYQAKLHEFNAALILAYTSMSPADQSAWIGYANHGHELLNPADPKVAKALVQFQLPQNPTATAPVPAGSPVVTQPQSSSFVLTMPPAQANHPAEVKNPSKSK